MSLNLHLPEQSLLGLKLSPKIAVFGVGGAGGNAVNNMIQSNLPGVNFIVANTDAQALEYSLSQKKIQLGMGLTKGLGAGSLPEIGKGAAEESINEIMEEIGDSNMLFITAGMGGGTGTGAAPVIARVAKENKILTVGVVTKPFHFEGAHRMRIAEFGLEELQKYVDTLIIIPNQNLFRIANEKTTFADAFRLADNVLHTGVRGITDLMILPGLINLDFADIRAVMSEMGKAMMGTGEAEGEDRAILAAEAAISNPLLDNISMKGAKGILINITGGMDMTLFEVDSAANRIREEVDSNANIIFGSTFNENSEGKIRVSVLATGIDSEELVQRNRDRNNIMNNKYTESSVVREGDNATDFINKYLANINNVAEDHDIAYYKPADPEESSSDSSNEDDTNINMKDEKKYKSQKGNMNLFNRVSEVIRNQKHSHPVTEEKSENSWSEDLLNIPTFLRKK